MVPPHHEESKFETLGYWLTMLFAYMVDHCYCGQIMMLVWGVLPVWADISVATLHSAGQEEFFSAWLCSFEVLRSLYLCH